MAVQEQGIPGAYPSFPEELETPVEANTIQPEIHLEPLHTAAEVPSVSYPDPPSPSLLQEGPPKQIHTKGLQQHGDSSHDTQFKEQPTTYQPEADSPVPNQHSAHPQHYQDYQQTSFKGHGEGSQPQHRYLPHQPDGDQVTQVPPAAAYTVPQYTNHPHQNHARLAPAPPLAPQLHYDTPFPPTHPADHWQNMNYMPPEQPFPAHQHNRQHSRQYREQQPQIQVVTQAVEPKSNVNMGEQMQMMMMNQMMMQQMQAQQMQAAQLAALTQQTFQSSKTNNNNNNNNNQNSGCGQAGNCRSKKKGGTVNIQSVQKKRRVRPRGRAAAPAAAALAPGRVIAGATTPPPPVIVQAPAAPTIDSMAMENWQEATILLCIAVVGMIYLVCSRAGGEEEKKESSAKKHMS